jgi:hypothetical protein
METEMLEYRHCHHLRKQGNDSYLGALEAVHLKLALHRLPAGMAFLS